MIHCFGYINFLFNNCVPSAKCENDFNNPSSRFYQLDNESVIVSLTSEDELLEQNCLSARNKSVKCPTLDVIPRKLRKLDNSSDWILKYSNRYNTAGSFGGNFSNFELVPWRQQKNRLDLLNSTAWEPEFNYQTRKFYKKNKKMMKKKIGYEKRVKRHIRVRILFSIELRHKRLEIFLPQIRARKFEKIYQSQLSIEAIKPDEHFGYFSQRTDGNFNIKSLSSDKKLTAISWKSDKKFYESKIICDSKMFNENKSIIFTEDIRIVKTVGFDLRNCEKCFR